MRYSTLLFILFLVSNTLYAQSFSKTQLLEDYTIMREALLTLHPGLYRFQDSSKIEDHFSTLKNSLKDSLTLKETYLLFSEFTAALQCGHTFCSYYNQPQKIRTALFDGSDKLPFTFLLHNDKMFLNNAVGTAESIPVGAEIISVNGVPIAEIISAVMKLTKGDGANNGKRLHSLQITGLRKYEPFDVYFPLLYPPINNLYSLQYLAPGASTAKTIEVQTVSRAQRFVQLERKFGAQPTTDDDLWKFKILNDDIAHLSIGTFVLQRLSFDYEDFLEDVFDTLEEKKIKTLILDIRGNEGGMDEVYKTLFEYLAVKPLVSASFKRLVTYTKVPEHLVRYLNTWDQSFYDRTDEVAPASGRFYRFTDERDIPTSLPKNPSAFPGSVVLLCDRANSSATFFLTKIFKENNLGTVIGETTGGNLMGTNGGQLFFLSLPNTGIEIDLPLIGYYPHTPQPNAGIEPDIEVKVSPAELLQGKDPILERALRFIENGK